MAASTHTASIIEELLHSPDAVIKRIYGEYRKEFFHWANREFNSSQDDAADVFQEAIIIFYKNAKQGKIQHKDASLKTYLFGIAKNLFLNRIKISKRTQPLSELQNARPENKAIDPYSKQEEQDHQKTKITAALNLLGETCRRIITLFYYRRYSTEAIMIEMGYKDEVTVRNRKLQCMKKLKEKVERGLRRGL